MKKYILAVVALLSLFMVVACKKTNTAPPATSCRMMTQISAYSGNTQCYYDDYQRILKLRYVTQPADTSWDIYHYDNGHVDYLVRLYKGTDGDTIYYTFTSGRYVEVTQYASRLVYLYNTSGKLVKIEHYEGSKITDYSAYLYNLLGNCILCTQFALYDTTYLPIQVTDLEFGDLRNPYSSMGLPPLNSHGPEIGVYLSPNNITKIRTQFTGQPAKMVFLYHYTASNENGYPTTYSITDSLNYPILENNISYICP